MSTTDEGGDEFPESNFPLHPNAKDYKSTNAEGGDEEFLESKFPLHINPKDYESTPNEGGIKNLQ